MADTKTEIRYEELYSLAMNRCLDKIDWDITEWLDEDELAEFAKLFEKIHGYKLS